MVAWKPWWRGAFVMVPQCIWHLPVGSPTVTSHQLLQGKLMAAYTAGMSLAVAGNDDVWLFVNGQRVIDLGGIHAPQVCVTFTRTAHKLDIQH